MARGFVEKYKRKSLLAALLLIFQGRVKYVTMLLLVVAVSLPFVFTSETFARMLEMPAISAVIKAMHLNGLVSAMNLTPRYSSEFVKSVMDKAAADSAQSSYWNRLMGAVNSALPCGGSGCRDVSSIAMITGGSDLYNAPVKKHRAPGEVTGVVSQEEKARGEGANTVDLEGVLGGGAGVPGGDSGLYGDVMGQNLAERYSGGAYSGAGPYVDRALISGPGGIEDRKSVMYASAMNKTGGMIPVPGRATKVPAARMGRASSFSWKNVGYKTKSDTVDKKIGTKRPMYQLAETYSAGNTAYRSKESATEYQAAYVGSTYDGNDINLDIIQTDANAPVLPEAGFSDTLDSAVGGQKLAEDCSKAQSVNGTKMSDDSAEMDRLANQGSAPMCYDDIGPWNQRVAQQGALCQDFNSNQNTLASACQTSNTPMDCSIYYKNTKSGGMVISKCQKPHGIAWLFFFLLLIVILIIIAIAIILGPLIAFFAAMFAYIAMSSMMPGGMGMGGGEDKYTGKDPTESDSKPGLEQKK